MLNFETRIGPYPQVKYPNLTVPQWYRDAKIGFFVHWGLYSVPGWALTKTPVGMRMEDAYIYHQYAEWYANTVRFLESPTREYHRKKFSEGTSYEDLADLWQPSITAVANIVDLVVKAGGRYLIPTTKHHDGFCLWDTKTTTFNASQRGPSRDLIAEFAKEAKQKHLRFGVYFSGAHDWHVADFPPISSDKELFTYRRNDREFAKYAATQLRELITKFSPDILWNDIEWPDAGKDNGPDSITTLFAEYLAQVPGGVVNDRWGVPAYGYLTREYSYVANTMPQVWEATRGIGRSFGYNQLENSDDYLSAKSLVELLVDVVSKNGNLIINIGPKADGTVVTAQAEVLLRLGEWLEINGEAIYGTRPWVENYLLPEGVYCTCTTSAENPQKPVKVHLFLTSHAQKNDVLALPAQLRGVTGKWLIANSNGVSEIPVVVNDGYIEVPAEYRSDLPITASFQLAQ